jgi:hypothetical protein
MNVLWVIGFMHGDYAFSVSVLLHFALLWRLHWLYMRDYLSKNKHNTSAAVIKK